MINIVDPHIHFFDLQRGKYKWLQPNEPPLWPDKKLINRNISIDEMTLNQEFYELIGLVHIEAGFDNVHPELEIQNVERIFDSSGLTDQSAIKVLGSALRAFRVISFVDITLANHDFKAALDKQLSYSSCVGIRHIFDDQTVSICRHPNTLQNLRKLVERGGVLELQFDLSSDTDTVAVIQMLERVPDLKVVINHAGFAPFLKPQKYSAWLRHLALLSVQKQIYIKVSGFEMVSREFRWQQAAVVIDDVAKSFGQHRLMLASNFPVCLLAKSYSHYWDGLLKCSQQIGLDLTAIASKNASDFYSMGI